MATITVHLGELHQIHEALVHFCRTTPRPRDCAPHSHARKDLVLALRKAMHQTDPEWASSIIGPADALPDMSPAKQFAK